MVSSVTNMHIRMNEASRILWLNKTISQSSIICSTIFLWFSALISCFFALFHISSCYRFSSVCYIYFMHIVAWYSHPNIISMGALFLCVGCCFLNSDTLLLFPFFRVFCRRFVFESVGFHSQCLYHFTTNSMVLFLYIDPSHHRKSWVTFLINAQCWHIIVVKLYVCVPKKIYIIH